MMLIDLLISTTIAALMSLTLMMIWNQVNKISITLTNKMNMYSRATLLQRQLFYDFSGIYVPHTTALKRKKEGTSSHSDKTLENIFVGSASGDIPTTISFITTNPLPQYTDAKGTSLPGRITRVTYEIEEEKKSLPKKTYTLYRSETPSLQTPKGASKNSSKRYPLIDGIKDIKIEYIAPPEETRENKANAGDNEPQAQKKEGKRSTFWPMEDKKKIEQTGKKTPAKLPAAIIVTGNIYDPLFKRSLAFNFRYTIVTVPAFANKKISDKVSVTPPESTNQGNNAVLESTEKKQ